MYYYDAFIQWSMKASNRGIKKASNQEGYKSCCWTLPHIKIQDVSIGKSNIAELYAWFINQANSVVRLLNLDSTIILANIV